eukprot:2031198-Prymnesium_polylepis.1
MEAGVAVGQRAAKRATKHCAVARSHTHPSFERRRRRHGSSCFAGKKVVFFYWNWMRVYVFQSWREPSSYLKVPPGFNLLLKVLTHFN